VELQVYKQAAFKGNQAIIKTQWPLLIPSRATVNNVNEESLRNNVLFPKRETPIKHLESTNKQSRESFSGSNN
jgi:hypothetical protein